MGRSGAGLDVSRPHTHLDAGRGSEVSSPRGRPEESRSDQRRAERARIYRAAYLGLASSNRLG